MVIRNFITIVLVLIYTSVFAQNENLPASLIYKLTSEPPTVIVKNEINLLTNRNNKLPVQAGYTLPFKHKLYDLGIWNKVDNNLIWRLEINVPNAEQLNIYFSNINLNESDKIYIYNPLKSRTIDITNQESSVNCTDFVTGDRIIIELNSTNPNKKIPFTISEVGVKLPQLTRGFGNAGDCEVHINCPEGNNWQNEKNGVARVLVKEGSLTFWCSGSLINNTRNDGTPLFLTANHCGEQSDSIDYTQWLFYFNYQSEYCGQPVEEPLYNLITGSTLLAKSLNGTSASSDFKLLKLAESIPPEYKPYYNGWDRSGYSSPFGVTIHHPQGDVKMISTYKSSIVSSKYDNNNEDPDGKYWEVRWSETQSGHGVTEGGSSGSPIFNNEGNIVGALTGGRASCTHLNQPDYYGKLSYSWQPNDRDSTDNLSFYLDPLETGTLKLKGTNLDSTNVFAGFYGDPQSIIVGESVTFTNSSFGNISSYNWYFEGGTPEYSEMENPGSIRYNKAGEYNVKQIVNSGDGSDTLTAIGYIKVLPSISPNPSKGIIKLAFGGEVPENYTIRIFNSVGQEMGYRISEADENSLSIDIYPNKKGAYLVSFSSDQINTNYKVIIIGN